MPVCGLSRLVHSESFELPTHGFLCFPSIYERLPTLTGIKIIDLSRLCDTNRDTEGT